MAKVNLLDTESDSPNLEFLALELNSGHKLKWYEYTVSNPDTKYSGSCCFFTCYYRR